MNQSTQSISITRLYFVFFVVAIASGISNTVLAQERSRYLQGENNTLEMIVYVIGEVQNPGKYRVRDDTNIIEILAEAGGPSEFSNLNSVTITHAPADSTIGNQDRRSRVIKYNINEYLTEGAASPPPTLRPGDVVMVPKNKWRTWRNVATVLRDISVVASAYFLYLRATRD